MNIEFIQSLRYKLQKRYRKVNASDFNNFHIKLIHFWKFINEELIFKSLLEQLEAEIPKTLKDMITNANQKTIGENEKEDIQIAFLVLLEVAKVSIAHRGDVHLNKYTQRSFAEKVNEFKEDYVQIIYEYLDEQLDSNVAVLGIIKRYKYKCEWFLREKLQNKIKNNQNSKIEEQVLAPHLYEYLHDQGLDNLYEVKSGDNGRLDFRSNLEQPYQFIGEIKIYKDKKEDIYTGYKEILRHLGSNGLQTGYLIVFNNSNKLLEISPKIINQGKSIFIVLIDIRNEKQTPSNKKEKVVSITENDILDALKNRMKSKKV
jgi:hypothetical protein